MTTKVDRATTTTMTGAAVMAPITVNNTKIPLTAKGLRTRDIRPNDRITTERLLLMALRWEDVEGRALYLVLRPWET